MVSSLKPRSPLDADSVRLAYRRQARTYDKVFGGVSKLGRQRAVAAANKLPGEKVLEVGVGTGLALPAYDPDKRITGIDLSEDMLALAKARVERDGLQNVDELMVMDAENTSFADNSFDVVVGMFVASVVPHPDCFLAELKRVVKPCGYIIFVNHFLASGGIRLFLERLMAPASRSLGWHPDFAIESLLPPEDLARVTIESVPPCGLFKLVTLRNDKGK